MNSNNVAFAVAANPTAKFANSFSPNLNRCSSKLNSFVVPMTRCAHRSRPIHFPSLWEMKVGILFSTVTGNTDEVAQMIKEKLGDEADEPKDISDVDANSLTSYDALVVGAPTWNTDADSERSGTSWDEFIYDDLEKIDLAGKPVAIFGLGDGVGYADNFCDAIEELHMAFSKVGAKMIGYTSTDGVDFEESKSVQDGSFLGLPLDNTNYGDEMEGKVTSWCDQVLKEADIPASV